MKKILIAILLLLHISGMLEGREKVNLLRCSRKAATSFAIITDSKTFQECETELKAYRSVLEEEGLGTYLLWKDWNNPEEVKAEILKLNRKKPRLEGIVLVGDIPVVLVKRAQYMTTAFKMNEELYPEIESSVPSDRFYDDFDLDFEFSHQDSLRHNIFYYRLTEKGSQVLGPDIYSARMKVPETMEGDHYEILRDYLKKVVAAHQEQNNCLDHFTFFSGAGYNSDCPTIWRQKPHTFREQFPYAFGKASQNRFLNYRQKKEMKVNLADELQREETDFFQFSEHGAPDTQYLNDGIQGTSFESCYDLLKRSVASMFEEYKGTADEEPFLKEVLDSVYRLPRSAVSDSAYAVYARLDSIETEQANLYLKDLAGIRSNPRIVMLNACYNGSFHNEEGYVAGYHVFGKGRCVAAQGNTVNVLQDKWEDKLLGLLSIGERVGMWQKEIHFLESHLIGDPTFRFTAHNGREEALCRQLHHDLVFNQGEAAVWKQYLQSEEPILRSAGLVHLSYLGSDFTAEALDLLEHDPAWTVRLTAFHSLAGAGSEDLEKAVEIALEDSYEVVVRHACRTAGATGQPRLLPALEKAVERHPDMERVAFIAGSAMKILEPGTFRRNVERMGDQTLSERRRIDAMRLFRNNRATDAIATLEQILCDSSESEELRINAAEVLGWYDQHLDREEIAGELSRYLAENKASVPEGVRIEINKTIKRLAWE